MNDIININSISMFHEIMGYEKPKHPLITWVDLKNLKPPEEYYNRKYTTEFYIISMKNSKECLFKYGRKYYDFSEGSLIFLSPRQVAVVESVPDQLTGWLLCFHKDLILGTSLCEKMEDYTFFSYDSNEALHISEIEKNIIENIIETIRIEFSQNIDEYSRELIVSNLEVFLNYSKRFYGRQFLTRVRENRDIVAKFELVLKKSFEIEDEGRYGIPSVKYLANEMGYSSNYLSDLLKKETGKSTQEHIQLYLIEKAKDMLIGTECSIANISDDLGFSYPSHFSKFFKTKTGVSPGKFRKNFSL